MATEKTAVKLGAVRKCAAGGFIGSLFGSSKPETMTEKFARQDAEFKAKHPQQAQTPVAQAPSTTPTNAISGYAGMNAMQAREKAAGLKVGGMVRKKCVEGGEISGPGGPTDDLVPIMASNGEFMIKASSAKILGPKVLNALNNVGGKGAPSEPGKMAGGGMVRKMAAGGPVEEDRQKRIAQIPAGGTAPAPDGYDNGNDFTRNVNTSLNALGGMGVVASVPLKAAQAGQGAIRTAMNAAPVLQNGIPRLAAPIAKAAQAAPDFVAGASGVQRVGGANLPAVIQNTGIPVAKATNVALQEGAKANQAAAATRSFGNVSAGAGMLDQQQTPLEQVPPVAPTAPAPTAPAPTAPAPTAPAPTAPAAAPVDEFSNAAISQRNPGGMVRKVVGADGRTTYSGSNISGDVSFQGADGNALPGRPGGGFMTYGGMSQEQIKSALTNPDGSAWTAGDNAIMAANIRDGVDKYRGTSRDPRNDPMNQPMTKDQRAARVKMAEIASRERQNAQTGAREQEQLGMTRTEHVAKMAKEKQIADVQAEYLAAGDDPVKQAAAKRKMLALGLLKDGGDDFAYAPGGQVVVDGQLVTQPGVIFNKRTGQAVNGGQQSTQAAKATPRAEYDKLPKGSTYTGTDGQQYTKG